MSCEECKRLDGTLQDALRALSALVAELIRQRDEARAQNRLQPPPTKER